MCHTQVNTPGMLLGFHRRGRLSWQKDDGTPLGRRKLGKFIGSHKVTCEKRSCSSNSIVLFWQIVNNLGSYWDSALWSFDWRFPDPGLSGKSGVEESATQIMHLLQFRWNKGDRGLGISMALDRVVVIPRIWLWVVALEFQKVLLTQGYFRTDPDQRQSHIRYFWPFTLFSALFEQHISHHLFCLLEERDAFELGYPWSPKSEV